jgi:hypothetical protein
MTGAFQAAAHCALVLTVGVATEGIEMCNHVIWVVIMKKKVTISDTDGAEASSLY